eukprot:5809082-Amphidinium_carterae.1
MTLWSLTYGSFLLPIWWCGKVQGTDEQKQLSGLHSWSAYEEAFSKFWCIEVLAVSTTAVSIRFPDKGVKVPRGLLEVLTLGAKLGVESASGLRFGWKP